MSYFDRDGPGYLICTVKLYILVFLENHFPDRDVWIWVFKILTIVEKIKLNYSLLKNG